MGKQDRFMNEFKRDAVAQVEDRGYSVREVAWCAACFVI